MLTGYDIYADAGSSPHALRQSLTLLDDPLDAGADGDAATVQRMAWAQARELDGLALTTSAGEAFFRTGTYFELQVLTPCHTPNDPFLSDTFTATSTQLILYGPSPQGASRLTFTKQ